ncbi:MAG: LysR family transcriptional regulator [Synergistaceae bacterium]|nr:LysR family transcriptional regulator [Synergistaceae bacterium]
MQMSHLRYFAEIARVKNMTLAAKNLHVSQPSLTYAVRVLEMSLESRCFSVILTQYR